MTARIAARLPQRPHHVVMLAYPDVQMLDVTGPLAVFSRAARWMQDHGVRRDLAYRASGRTRASSGEQEVQSMARQVSRVDRFARPRITTS